MKFVGLKTAGILVCFTEFMNDFFSLKIAFFFCQSAKHDCMGLNYFILTRNAIPRRFVSTGNLIKYCDKTESCCLSDAYDERRIEIQLWWRATFLFGWEDFGVISRNAAGSLLPAAFVDRPRRLSLIHALRWWCCRAEYRIVSLAPHIVLYQFRVMNIIMSHGASDALRRTN